jgi:hypothetical protein
MGGTASVVPSDLLLGPNNKEKKMGRHNGGRPSLREANSSAGFARIEQFMLQVDSTEKGMFNE